MILSMEDPKTDDSAKLEELMRVGNYREARQIAKRLHKGSTKLNEAQRQKVDNVLAITGRDPFVVGGFVLTVSVIVFLIIKYVL